MKIEPTQADIDDGEPCNGFRCGFALALNRQLPGGPWHVGSGGSVSRVGPSGGNITSTVAQLPDEAIDAIALYDSRGNQGKRLVMPFEFELDVEKNQEPERRTI